MPIVCPLLSCAISLVSYEENGREQGEAPPDYFLSADYNDLVQHMKPARMLDQNGRVVQTL